MKKNSVFILIIFLSLSTAGCGGIINTVQESSYEGSVKYNIYVELNNIIIGEFDNALAEYFFEFGTASEMYIRDDFSLFLFNFDYEQVVSHVNDAILYSEALPEYKATDDYVKVLAPLMLEYCDLFEKIKIYYAEKTFMKDDFIEGAKLHEELLKYFEKYDVLSNSFLEEFKSVIETESKKQMDFYLKNDYLVLYYANLTLNKAMQLDSIIYEQKIYSENLLDFDISQFELIYSEFEIGLDKLIENSEDAQRIKKENLDPTLLSLFINDLEQVRITTSSLTSRVQSNVTPPYLNNPLEEEGAPEKLSKEIGKAVGSFNKMIE